MDYRQDAPFAVQIELVEGCSLSCEFCGINGIREKPGNYKAMPLPVVQHLANALEVAMQDHGWNPRLEFAMHGEPTMHPELEQAIGIIRQAVGPKVSMVLFSNGTGFLKDARRLDRVLDAGINTIGLDAYEHVDFVPRIIKAYTLHHLGPGSEEQPYTGANIYNYPAEKEHNLHSGRRVGHRDIVVIQDISKADEGNHSTLNTHCGGGMAPQAILQARCAKPFRELAIRWDGNVAICCNDFRGVYKVGNIMEHTLDEIWQHPRFMAARRRLMNKDRSFGPCRFCNAKSMRVGLLPDKMGKQNMGPYTQADDDLIVESVSGMPYTTPVLRQWEQKPADRALPAHLLLIDGLKSNKEVK